MRSVCGIGGGILNHGDATIGQSTISGNSAAEGGGGIFTGGGTLRVLDSTISGNTADDSGGGAMVFGTTVSVSNSTISRNNAAFGGGIWVGFRAEVTLIQSTISGNTAGEGGGIVNLQGAVNVSNTIIANSTGADCWNGVIRLEAGRADLFDPVPECLPGEFTRFVYSVDVSLACRSRDGNLLLIDFPARVRTSLGAARPGLQSNLLNVVFYRDREHNLWIGTDGDGLYRVRRRVITTYSSEEGLRDRNIYPVYQDRAGAIWLGAWPSTVSRLKDGRVTNYSREDGLSGGRATLLYEDRDGRLWVGAHDANNGLRIFRDGRFVDPPGLANLGVVMTMIQDRHGAMWFGTDDGLVRFLDGQATAAQQAFSRQLIASQEAERKRIAAEMHDSLGQRLVIIKNLAMLVTSAATDGIRDRVEEISAEASLAIGEVREIAQNLRPHHLDRLGLTKALESLVRKAADASTIKFTAEVDALDDVFPREAEINVYRVVQESVNNVLRHSKATEASLMVQRTPSGVRLVVRDNGRGFATTRADGHGQRIGFGLAGIVERVTLLGGHADVRSAPGQGTTITVTFEVGDGQRVQ